MILDTQFLIDILRGNDSSANEKTTELDAKFGVKGIATISVMELWKGAVQSIHQEKEKRKVNELIQSLFVHSFTEEDAKKAGEIEADLKKRGEMIDLEDIMIAGAALARNETILTRNIRHFNKIKGLNLESY
ncbi:PIN domain-containing protein [Candidatus Woesearchaeota archaeon]|nr:PIN domain-containing protein [Candidatus Woesearchaeota archaeon]MBI2130575.1 PIN domain-containing protein [Candidatus Woesearchaeota archaeon]MBI2661255.1 PIN domain-containing protein [Candidatus Woesearchaeota archaeon]